MQIDSQTCFSSLVADLDKSGSDKNSELRGTSETLYVKEGKKPLTNLISRALHREAAHQAVIHALQNEFFISRQDAESLLRDVKENPRGPITLGDILNLKAHLDNHSVSNISSNVDQIEKAQSLKDLYNVTTSFDSGRSHLEVLAEAKANTEKVNSLVSASVQSFVAENPIPTQNGEPLFSIHTLGFGSMARGEMLLVSDMDLQLLAIATPDNQDQALAYAESLKSHIVNEWAEQRAAVGKGSEGNALGLDWVGGSKGSGVVIADSMEKAVLTMTPNTKINLDIYADSTALFESKPGVYGDMLSQYEADNPDAKKLVKSQLDELSEIAVPLHSAKNAFARPLTKGISGLYKMHHAQSVNPSNYETNTLSRAEWLHRNGKINDTTLANIKDVLSGALKYEQDAGLEKWQHGSEISAKDASSKLTKEMIEKSSQIAGALREALMQV